MREASVVLCGGASPAGRVSSNPLRLNLHGAESNVSLKIADVSSAMLRGIPDVVLDLVELAVYVFSADQAVGRGGVHDDGKAWRRRFQFHIPVRRPELWSRTEVIEALVDVLSFLSDDDYAFAFTKLDSSPPVQLYFEPLVPDFDVDEVLLFSGGIDSLAGAIQEAVVDRRRVVLVSHTSATKRKPQVATLAADVAALAASGAVRHIPVSATKAEHVGREYTQRTRSFLYAALAATVASILGRNRIRFYENGVTSLNLPIAPQVVGGRATRTTHPLALQGFELLFTRLFERPFSVENPFIWKTKTDIVRLMKSSGHGRLVARSVSCSKTIAATKLHTHCGACSQCIDRRFATLAAGFTDDEDPAEMYKVDLLTGERSFGENRAMAESFLQRASRLRLIDELDFFTEYPEATRALRHVGLSSEEAGKRILEIHRRHGEDVAAALAEGHRRHARDFQQGKLPDSCILVLAVPGRYRQAASDAATAIPTFRLEGDFWIIAFEHERANLKDSNGLRHIARLLTSPGRQFHSADLLAYEAGHTESAPSGSGGEASDRKSILQYRARLQKIEEELVEAESAGNVERRVELREEAAQISRHLRGVTDIRGNPRQAAEDGEKARQSVSVAVRRAMKAISRKHPPLWRHFRKYLKTGLFCVYEPDPPQTWVTE